jgi:hypothetical protein
MSLKACPYEDAVVAAARSGHWSPELSAHRDSCLTCAEVTLVVAALAADADKLTSVEPPLPDPAVIWLRARLASRERNFERATRAIVWVQRTAVAAVLAVALVFAPGLWNLITSAVLRVDFSSPTADLPRATGSPLLVVVVSMLVLGGLALWELTVAQED